MSIKTDPESLERVAHTINSSMGEIDAAIQKMRSSLATAQWNDPVRQKFEGDFAALINDLKRFQASAPQTVQHLKAKANQLRQYQS